MKEVKIYTTETCPFCVKAKRLLQRKGVEYEELRVDLKPELIDESIEKSGGLRTVPQIFIGDHHVGGCDELYDLERQNKLDVMLDD